MESLNQLLWLCRSQIGPADAQSIGDLLVVCPIRGTHADESLCVIRKFERPFTMETGLNGNTDFASEKETIGE